MVNILGKKKVMRKGEKQGLKNRIWLGEGYPRERRKYRSQDSGGQSIIIIHTILPIVFIYNISQ